jgi:hypothetical protein
VDNDPAPEPFAVFVPAAGTPLVAPTYLTFGHTNSATLAYSTKPGAQKSPGEGPALAASAAAVPAHLSQAGSKLSASLQANPDQVTAALGGGHARVLLLLGDATVFRLLPNDVIRAYPPSPIYPPSLIFLRLGFRPGATHGLLIAAFHAPGVLARTMDSWA